MWTLLTVGLHVARQQVSFWTGVVTVVTHVRLCDSLGFLVDNTHHFLFILVARFLQKDRYEGLHSHYYYHRITKEYKGRTDSNSLTRPIEAVRLATLLLQYLLDRDQRSYNISMVLKVCTKEGQDIFSNQYVPLQTGLPYISPGHLISSVLVLSTPELTKQQYQCPQLLILSYNE